MIGSETSLSRQSIVLVVTAKLTTTMKKDVQKLIHANVNCRFALSD